MKGGRRRVLSSPLFLRVCVARGEKPVERRYALSVADIELPDKVFRGWRVGSGRGLD